jgi:putative SOS response-associated peptidase YedK
MRAKIEPELPLMIPNKSPTDWALVVRRHPKTGERLLSPLRFGLIPYWVKDLKQAKEIQRQTFNARSETIATKPAFRSAFEKRRCLIPADGFVEWKGEKPPKQPYAILPADGGLITFAGLWENWRNPETDEWVRTFSIVTTDPNETLLPIHNRMPAILPEEHHARWLGEEPAEPAELLTMLQPRPSNALWAFPLQKKVTGDDARLLELPADAS